MFKLKSTRLARNKPIYNIYIYELNSNNHIIMTYLRYTLLLIRDSWLIFSDSFDILKRDKTGQYTNNQVK